MSPHDFFATAPRGLEPLLAAELATLGASGARAVRGGVRFEGDLALAFRACLWSRLASRVLMPLASFGAADSEELYQGVQAVDWREHLRPEGTLAVDFTGTSPALANTQFGARRVKDAVVDQFRARFGVRPSVDLANPDLRLNVHLEGARAEVRLDLSGESLHRRGYRLEGAAAPLKENLAAAILVRAGWPEVAAAGGPLLDPLCGSGTLPIEAARMAADIAPGLLRPTFGFLSWPGQDAAAWRSLLAEAEERRRAGLERLPPVAGFDRDPAAIRAARANAGRAGLAGLVSFERRELSGTAPPEGAGGRPGLLVANPPYGERLGTEKELRPLYETLGRVMRERFVGWRAAVFTGNPGLAVRLGIRARRSWTLYNGPLECRLFSLEVEPRRFMRERGEAPAAAGGAPAPLSAGAGMLANRLAKNLKTVGVWARREGISCFRLYDADLPEYAAAVDLYREHPSGTLWAVVQEYAAPPEIDPRKASGRLQETLAAVPAALGIPAERTVLKVRKRQKGGSQYGKLASEGNFMVVSERDLLFRVNLTDYLDTGLFLDHRPTREMIRGTAGGARFLNLFGYTGTATVAAAAGGAASTATVDMSATYLDWAGRNLALNGFKGHRHRLVRAEAAGWLKEQSDEWDLVFLDPPTFSTSKRMAGTLDTQRDHPFLIRAAARLLSREGTLIFSTNYRRFKLDERLAEDFLVEEMTRRTIPRDFARNPRIHQCWLIRRRPGGSRPSRSTTSPRGSRASCCAPPPRRP